MKIKLFNLFARMFTVFAFSFASFLPFFAWDYQTSLINTHSLYLCLLAGALAGSGYGVYRFLQEMSHDDNNKNTKTLYNIKYEHTTIDIKERATV